MACATVLAGCSSSHSSLSPAGPQAHEIASLIWLFTGICGAIWLAVLAVLLHAILRRRGSRPDPLATSQAGERRIGSVIAVCVGATAFTVIGLTVLSYFSQRSLFAAEPSALTIQVTGHQWWWAVRYEGEQPSRTFTTANEIHVPVGEPIKVVLKTDDVIHSFWIPSLAGKMDAITGQQNELRFSVTRPGVYRGQCAEFCGRQHAKMAFFVIASPRAEFEAWRDAQIKPAVAPRDRALQNGLHAFFASGCMLCHTIRGANAGGKVGPDLTHVGSRRTIAAGTLPNTPARLSAWIADPQHFKPGAQMPAMPVTGTELNVLVQYLTSLK